jgi:hypothetical protein
VLALRALHLREVNPPQLVRRNQEPTRRTGRAQRFQNFLQIAIFLRWMWAGHLDWSKNSTNDEAKTKANE